MKVVDIKSTLTKTLKRWTAQKKRELRNMRAARNRGAAFARSVKWTAREAVWKFLPSEYEQVSDHGRLPAAARQLFYRIREPANEYLCHLKDGLIYNRFSQEFLPGLISDHPNICKNWWVTYEPRGQLREPHTELIVSLGTLAVDKYLRNIRDHEDASVYDAPPEFSLTFPTCGPKNRFSGILFIEKAGFNPLFRAVKLAERYDLAIMSCKGQSVVSARMLVDHLCAIGAEWGCTVYILHDFDAYGMSIAQTLIEVTEAAREGNRVRYEFENEVNVIDLGLRLSDVEEWNLRPERCQFRGAFRSDSIATHEEQHFLRTGRRVELNAFTSSDFIAWIESGLNTNRVRKVIPDSELLVQAYRHALCREMLNAKSREQFDSVCRDAETAAVPENLETLIRAEFDVNPAMSWDSVIADLAREKVKTAANGFHK